VAIIARGQEADDLVVMQDRLVMKQQRFGIMQPALDEAARKPGLALPQHRRAADEIALAGPDRKAQEAMPMEL